MDGNRIILADDLFGAKEKMIQLVPEIAAGAGDGPPSQLWRSGGILEVWDRGRDERPARYAGGILVPIVAGYCLIGRIRMETWSMVPVPECS